MPNKTVKIPNINCSHCVMTIEKRLSVLEGVTKVKGDAASKTIAIEWTEPPANWEKIKALLVKLRYAPIE